jgi:hypothetical protein
MGTFVRAQIEGLWLENIVKLPRTALREGETVLVASAEKEMEIRDIEILRSEPEWIYVSNGLNDGDLVITTAIEAPIPGSKLAISESIAADETPGEAMQSQSMAELEPAQ